MPRKQPDTTEVFIEKAKRIHGDRYGYEYAQYVDSYTDVIIVCSVHGNFTQRPNNHLHGAGCRQCGIENKDLFHRRSLQEFIDRAREVHGDRYDYSLVNYKNSNTKVTIICPVHGQFRQDAGQHLGGANCIKCSYMDRGQKAKERWDNTPRVNKSERKKRRDHALIPRITDINEVDYHFLAEKKGYRWVGLLPESTHENTLWICNAKGHRWNTSYEIIKQRHVCHYCSQRARKTIEDYHILAEEAELKLTGDKPEKVTHKTWWQCKKNSEHKWFVTYNEIHQGARCPYCSGKYRRTPDDYKNLGQIRKFEWLGPEVEYTSQPTEWKCQYNHRWWATYSNIHNRKSGCPHCKESKGESRVAKYLDQFTFRYERQMRFPECRNEMELPFDFYFRIGNKVFLVEYDGILHFEIPEQWGGEKALKEVQKRDQIKTDFAKNNGFILIRIPYTIEAIERYLQDEIEKYLGCSLDTFRIDSLPPQERQRVIELNPYNWQQMSFV